MKLMFTFEHSWVLIFLGSMLFVIGNRNMDCEVTVLVDYINFNANAFGEYLIGNPIHRCNVM